LSSPFLLGLVIAAALTPREAIPIAPVVGRYVSDVAWETSGTVLLATEKGILRYSLRTRTAETLIATTPLPDGLADPVTVSSDGLSVVATSDVSVGGYAMRLADRKRLSAIRVPLIPLDVAVRGPTQCILAMQMNRQTDEAVFCGPVEKSWLKYKPLHRISSGDKSLRFANAVTQAGAIALAADGSVAVITNVEPGVFRYAPDGTPLETLGRSFDELVLPMTQEIKRRFAMDVDGRYRLVLNAQPTLEDLVLTPRGPAIVVRIAEKGRVRWELWWPRADGGVVPPTPLGIDRIGPFGHLKCDARGTSLACIGALPDRKKAADYRVSEDAPHLWIFELPK
jgi:hypothetical protein